MGRRAPGIATVMDQGEKDGRELADLVERQVRESERIARQFEAFTVELAEAVVELVEGWKLGLDGKPVAHFVARVGDEEA